MKAIETDYRGCRFRSRTEARWAVFFDWINVRWEYEPEGYVLSDGTRYLPDFFLPGFHAQPGLFVEVKSPVGDFSKAMKFSREVGPILLADGAPDFKAYDVAGLGIEGYELMPSCFSTRYLDGGKNASEYRLYTMAAPSEARWWHEQGMVYDGINEARAARFEFGEAPMMDRHGTN